MKRVLLRKGSRRAAQLAMLQVIDAIDAVADTPRHTMSARWGLTELESLVSASIGVFFAL